MFRSFQEKMDSAAGIVSGAVTGVISGVMEDYYHMYYFNPQAYAPTTMFLSSLVRFIPENVKDGMQQGYSQGFLQGLYHPWSKHHALKSQYQVFQASQQRYHQQQAEAMLANPDESESEDDNSLIKRNNSTVELMKELPFLTGTDEEAENMKTQPHKLFTAQEAAPKTTGTEEVTASPTLT